MYLFLSPNRATGASSGLSGNYRPKYKIQPGLSLVEPDAERLVQMMEREKMRKMMLTAILYQGMSAQTPCCRKIQWFGRNRPERHDANLAFGDSPNIPSSSPRSRQWSRLGGFALQRLDGTNPLGKAEEVIKASCLHLPFTMHLLFHWKYKPLRLMLGIRL